MSDSRIRPTDFQVTHHRPKKCGQNPRRFSHEKIAKHALHHHPRQLSAQRAGDAGGGAGAQEGGAVAGAFHRAYFLLWECVGVAVFAGVLR